MNIFNSLGSNYSLGFALKALFAGGDKSKELKEFLEKKYGGKVVLLYKGREAIELALSLAHLPEGSKVGVNGFTCFAVEDAIKEANFIPHYIDIEKDSLNFTPEAFLKVLEDKTIKAVIIQNTLGYPADGDKIAKICKEKGVLLIEDLAHSIGAKYGEKEAGSLGDFVVLSFSQDKMVDGISGGALIIRNEKFQISNNKFQTLSGKQQIVDRFYPIFTWKIRFFYPVFLGKLYHAVLKSLKLLSAPMAGNGKPTQLPGWYTTLATSALDGLDESLAHRREIAEVYAQTLTKEVLLKSHISQINESSSLRFPILIKNRAALINYLKKGGIYVSDIWYDAPIAPKKYMNVSGYKAGSCPKSEEISDMILNLPTHKNVSKEDAQKIAEEINKWLTK